MGAAAAAAGDELAAWVKTEAAAAAGGKEERILVSVRLRPLNGKEYERGDTCDWECVGRTTIVYKHSLPERALYSTAYTFDRVFGCDSTTRQVYEDGAKEVALSVVSGINSSIFAYGQTSSGKTYTMTGITEYSVADIYEYIRQHGERQFILKFSAMEIYNEAVRDLLSADATPLRLLDDPEKGTIVERLTEETLRDQDHLRELLSICEAQRQIGETSLNEMSSRSHQILRLTIESSTREYRGRDGSSTLMACVNFVDLAGSERASQALSAGVRLKEGCHINRSLLTLGTVIRKLSKGRNGHVPYRDSKLTRILQPALGGNARTAIICTMSPAHSHVEQSRNTLLFASCAKEVVTNAHVNVVMSDKALVKHLQRELARLETQLRFPGPTDCPSHTQALLKKDAQIIKLERELKELMQQRDMVQSRLDDLLQTVGDDHSSRQWDELSRTSGTHGQSQSEEVFSNSDTYGNSYYQDPDFSNLGFTDPPQVQSQLPQLLFRAVSDGSSEDDHCREVQCIEINNQISHSRNDDFSILLPEETESLLPFTEADKLEHCRENSVDSELPLDADQQAESESKTIDIFSKSEQNSVDLVLVPEIDQKEELDGFDKEEVKNSVDLDLLPAADQRNASFTKGQLDGLTKSQLKTSVDLVSQPELDQETDNSPKKVEIFAKPELKACVDPELPHEGVEQQTVVNPVTLADMASSTPPRRNLTKSRSCRANLMITPANWFEELEINTKTPPDHFFKDFAIRPERVRRSLYTQNSENLNDRLSIVSSKFGPDEFVKAPDMGIVSVVECVEGERDVDQDQYSQEDLTIDKTVKDVGVDLALSSVESPSRWPVEFERKQQEIIELWQACHVSLVHRTYFFLLFKGDPADSIYMEVEHRRLTFLKTNFPLSGVGKPGLATNANTAVASSLKNLRREREMLYRQMLKKLTMEDRESLYTKWGIALNSKQRRLQLARRVWTQTDMEHVRESASLVAKLNGMLELGRAPKEMFGLSFTATPPRTNRRSFSWKME